jgi:hypothetical protein
MKKMITHGLLLCMALILGNMLYGMDVIYTRYKRLEKAGVWIITQDKVCSQWFADGLYHMELVQDQLGEGKGNNWDNPVEIPIESQAVFSQLVSLSNYPYNVTKYRGRALLNLLLLARAVKDYHLIGILNDEINTRRRVLERA